jgi:hypothetical protein
MATRKCGISDVEAHLHESVSPMSSSKTFISAAEPIAPVEMGNTDLRSVSVAHKHLQ